MSSSGDSGSSGSGGCLMAVSAGFFLCVSFILVTASDSGLINGKERGEFINCLKKVGLKVHLDCSGEVGDVDVVGLA